MRVQHALGLFFLFIAPSFHSFSRDLYQYQRKKVLKSQNIIFQNSLIQDVANETADICDSSIARKSVSATWGQSLHLGSFVKMPEVLQPRAVTWYHYSREKGRHPITFKWVQGFFMILLLRLNPKIFRLCNSKNSVRLFKYNIYLLPRGGGNGHACFFGD